ncbi:hypothetical protein GCM10022231_05100 [Gordonia caeni]|uniref:Uncharacterized protein n=1 Tax=Gordonia caeni TaxID=1007097 RepID=A0ABP7NMK4_9ACTN
MGPSTGHSTARVWKATWVVSTPSAATARIPSNWGKKRSRGGLTVVVMLTASVARPAPEPTPLAVSAAAGAAAGQ